MNHSFQERLIWGFLIVMVFVVAVATRMAVLHANLRNFDQEMPFTLESAIQFRMTERVVTGEGIPRHEPSIQHPEGIAVFRTDTVLAEYVYAHLAGLLPDTVPLSTRVRWILVIWFSLSAPLLAWWVKEWTASTGGGFVAGFLYAVSLSAVIRSSGLEMSRENFAIPLLLAHLAMNQAALNRSGRWRSLYPIGSALALGLALATWDMIQFYVWLWSALFAWQAMAGHLWNDARAKAWISPAIAILGAAILSPYHRFHGLWFSPPLLLIWGSLLICVLGPERLRTVRQRIALMAILVGVGTLVARGYMQNYGHFGELLWAKIRFLNQKPADPSLLTFNQRIMWVPALDSATWALTRMFFPSILFALLLGGLGAFLVWKQSRGSAFPKVSQQIPLYASFLGISLLAYVLFVRFHVFVSIFACAWLGCCYAVSRRHGVWVRWITGLLILIVMGVEAAHVWMRPGEWGRPNVAYREVAEVATWLRDYGEGQAVLANFGLSASLWAYADVPVILHPKFETPAIRDRVRAYGEALFTRDEREFRDWADERGAAYFVYAVGEFAERSPELQMRYFVNALVPSDEAAARVFEYNPEATQYFEWLEGNRRYRLFRVISRADEEAADLLTIQAMRALQRGDLDAAAQDAWNALALFPNQFRAQEIIAMTESLRDGGFRYQPVLEQEGEGEDGKPQHGAVLE